MSVVASECVNDVRNDRQRVLRVGRHELLSDHSGSRIKTELHLRDLLIDFFHELNDKVDELVFEHGFRVEVGNQEGNVIALKCDVEWLFHPCGMDNQLTGMALRRKTTKFSARCIKKRENLWHSILSISSACLILRLMRTELMDPSISTRSFSFLAMLIGVNKSSFDALWKKETQVSGVLSTVKKERALPCFYFWFVVSLNDL